MSWACEACEAPVICAPGCLVQKHPRRGQIWKPQKPMGTPPGPRTAPGRMVEVTKRLPDRDQLACGHELMLTPSQRKNTKPASRRCRECPAVPPEHRYRITCAVCRVEFLAWAGRKVCSTRCGAKIGSLNRVRFAEAMP